MMSIICVTGFTGIDSAYEKPENPEVSVKAGKSSIDECVQEVVSHLVEKVLHLFFLLQFFFNLMHRWLKVHQTSSGVIFFMTIHLRLCVKWSFASHH